MVCVYFMFLTNKEKINTRKLKLYVKNFRLFLVNLENRGVTN